jgi:hypothetical protein
LLMELKSGGLAHDRVVGLDLREEDQRISRLANTAVQPMPFSISGQTSVGPR